MESFNNQAVTSSNIQDANAATNLSNDDERRLGQYTVNDGSGGASSGAAGIATSTMVITQQAETNDNIGAPILRLSLRPRSNVTWDENVINNEGMGRKSSKRCCIFHKKREVGE